MKTSLTEMKTDFLHAIKKPSFLLKFTAIVLNFVSYLLWMIPEEGETGLKGDVFEECLFAHATPAHMVILPTLCLAERPGRWFHRVFLGVGAILFGSAGIKGLLNYINDPTLTTPPLCIAVINLIICAILLADLLFNENVFGFFRRKSES